MSDFMNYACKNCGHQWEMEVHATPIIPAVTWGPQDSCSPQEGGDFEIISGGACEKCGTEVDEGKATEQFFKHAANDRHHED